MFNARLSKELIKFGKKNKNSELFNALTNKMEEICSQDNETINHYKNLRYDLSDCKRVHLMKSFVLIFKVDFKNNEILFLEVVHHDDAYN